MARTSKEAWKPFYAYVVGACVPEPGFGLGGGLVRQGRGDLQQDPSGSLPDVHKTAENRLVRFLRSACSSLLITYYVLLITY